MPSQSPEQHRLMMAVAKNPAFAKKAGIPQRVGADFMKADKGRKFAKGGDMAKKMPPFMGKETKAEEAKEMKVKAKSFALYKKGEKAEGVHGKSGKKKPTKYAAGGGCELKGKTKAFAMGGMPVGMAPRPAMAATPPGGQFGNLSNVKPNAMGSASQVMTPKQTRFTAPGGPQVGMAPRPPMDSVKLQQAQQMQQAARKAQQMQQTPIMPRKNVPLGPPPTGAAMGPSPTSSARPTNPFTNPKQYQTEYKAEMAKQEPKPFAKPPMATKTSMRLDALKDQARKGMGKPPMAEQRGGLSNMSPEAKSKIGDALAKMMGGVRATGAKTMASRGDTGFNALNMMDDNSYGAKKGGSVKTFAKGGSIDGCATKGKTKGKGRIF